MTTDMPDLRLEDVRRLRLELGDALILTVPQGIGTEVLRASKRVLEDAFPGHRIVVLTAPWSLDVITAADLAAVEQRQPEATGPARTVNPD